MHINVFNVFIIIENHRFNMKYQNLVPPTRQKRLHYKIVKLLAGNANNLTSIIIVIYKMSPWISYTYVNNIYYDFIYGPASKKLVILNCGC